MDLDTDNASSRINQRRVKTEDFVILLEIQQNFQMLITNIFTTNII